MKKFFAVFSLFFCGLFALSGRSSAAHISAHSAIVYEPNTGTVLFEKAADEQMLIASTTKIMTAMVVLENCAPDETVSVTAAHAATEGSSMYLKPGEDYTVEQLLYGMMLASGNDAAAALADHCAGSMDAFAALMNDKCAQLGLQNTHFINAHGLDAPEQYSSARDLALITTAAMQDPDFCNIFACKSYTTHGMTYVNHNKLLTSLDGCIGGKTGYTNAAGRTLVSCAERDGMRLICVTISDPRDWDDHAALYEEAFAAWRYIPLPETGWAQLQLLSGTSSKVDLRCGVRGIVVPSESEVRLRVYLPRFAFAPVNDGENVGKLEIFVDGAYAATDEIRFGETVPLDGAVPLTRWEQFKRLWYMANRANYGIYYLHY